EPLRLYAEPVGPASARGCPLRLSLPEPAVAKKATTSNLKYADINKQTKPATLQDISDQTPPDGAEIDTFVGRKLAGGKRVIEKCVGVGGAGTVYRALHRDLQMHVAVKLMHESFQRDADFCKRFHQEALSASRLDQAHLTRVLDFGQEPDGLLYLAMEFLD